MGRNEEVRLRRVELHSLHNALGLRERSLAARLAQRIDHHLGRGLQVVSHSCKVVSLSMPHHLLDDVRVPDLNRLSPVLILREGPLLMLFLLVTRSHIL